MKIERESVFVVDDDALVRNALSQTLLDNGYLPVMMECAEDVLPMGIPIRKIILDIFMPGMGGIEGITRIREKFPDAKIIAISGGWPNMDKNKVLEAAKSVGADYALAKPFTDDELLAALA